MLSPRPRRLLARRARVMLRSVALAAGVVAIVGVAAGCSASGTPAGAAPSEPAQVARVGVRRLAGARGGVDALRGYLGGGHPAHLLVRERFPEDRVTQPGP